MIVPDLSGNGNDGVITGRVSTLQSDVGPVLSLKNQKGCVITGDINEVSGSTQVTIAVWFKADAFANYHRLFEYGASSWKVMTLYQNGTTEGDYNVQYADETNTLRTVGVLSTGSATGIWQRAVYTIDFDEGYARVYLNGKKILETATIGNSLYVLGTGQKKLYIGSDPVEAGTERYQGELRIDLYNESKDAAWAYQDYMKSAKNVLFHEDWSSPVSPSNLTAGDIRSWKISPGGTWKLDEDDEGKFLSCVAGTDVEIIRPSKDLSDYYTETFEKTGTATLTKNTENLTIVASAGAKIRSINIIIGQVA